MKQSIAAMRTLVVSACVLPGALISMSAVTAHAEMTFDRIKEARTVKVGIANINPYGYVDGDGNITGQSPELLRNFFATLDVEVEPVVTEFGSLIGGLLAGHFDIVSTGMLIHPDRCAVVAFGHPEYRSENAFAVQRGNPKNLTSYQSVASDESAKIGMITGSGEIGYATRSGITEDQQVLFPDLTTAMAALQAKRVDAVVASTVTMRNAVSRADSDMVEYITLTEQPVRVDGTEATRYGAMAFRKDDFVLRETWNTWLVESLANGTVTQIIEPFGFGTETLPPVGLTADDVCSS